jgi:sugar fermentation stimulation protein A
VVRNLLTFLTFLTFLTGWVGVECVIVLFEQKLMTANLIRRYKRFLADVRLTDGSELTVHCPNSGSMKACLGDGWPVLLSDSHNPKRKYRWTWELVHNGTCWIGINTHRANRLAVEAITGGIIAELGGFSSLKREVPYGENSRIDILLERPDSRCYVEVKNVTLVDSARRYSFPDAVTTRGQKHLNELMDVVAAGDRGVILFVIQRSDGSIFVPADDIDPAYGELLREAASSGVDVLAYRAEVEPTGIDVFEPVTVEL